MFKKNFKQNDQNNEIRRIFLEKLCQFLRNNFEINSSFNIFCVFNEKKTDCAKK